MENKYEYTYSATKNTELERIRKKYTPQTSAESKMEQIKKLDSSVEKEALAWALGTGIPGSLVLGIGMCCTMVWTDLFILGMIIGIIGIALCCCAYPVYKSMLRKKREKIAPQILKLTNELENNNNVN